MLRLSILFFASTLSAISFSKDPAPSTVLSSENYLMQVRNEHKGYKAAHHSQLSATLKAQEVQMLFKPVVFSSFQSTYDKKPGTLVPYESTEVQTLQVGAQQTTSMGITAKAYYSLIDQRYNHLLMNNQPTDVGLRQASPAIEISLQLWRNWLGRESASLVNQAHALGQQGKLGQSFVMKTILAQAAGAYWALTLARETTKVAQDAVKRNESLIHWHKDRVGKGLGDRVDFLQADAALEASRIMLENSQNNEQTARRAFNLARGKESSEVLEILTNPTAEFIASLTPPKRQEMRDDVKAAVAQAQVADAQATVIREKYKPSFEVFASASLNNPNPLERAKAVEQSLSTQKPTAIIGLRLTAPLGGNTTKELWYGYKHDKLAALASINQKKLEQEDAWASLNDCFQQAKNRVQSYLKLEAKQKEKFEYEQERRKNGRTTTQQVLLFKGDFEAAQMARLQSLFDFFSIYSQMKLFEELANEPS